MIVRKEPELESISIHALREEGDPWAARLATTQKPFLSTPSVRRATNLDKHCGKNVLISIHALREEGDALLRPYRAHSADFYPRPP